MAEISEAWFGKSGKTVSWFPKSRAKILGTAALVAACAIMIVHGEPSPEARWEHIKGKLANKLESREVYVHPREVVELKKDPTLYVRILDVRPEPDFNLFHIGEAVRLDLAEISKTATLKPLLEAPDNTVFFLVSNEEHASTRAWKELKAGGVLNLYIIEGGINKWLEVFPPEPCLLAGSTGMLSASSSKGHYDFVYAVGSQSRAAHPDSIRTEPWVKCPEGGNAATFAVLHSSMESAEPAYVRKVKMLRKVAVKGGCG